MALFIKAHHWLKKLLITSNLKGNSLTNLENFRPTGQWQWVFDNDTQQLCVDIGSQIIAISYKARMLVLACDFPLYFSLEDVRKYNDLFEHLPLAHCSEKDSCVIILHLLAVDLFHKPIMPKDWLFQIPEKPLSPVIPENIVSLCAKNQTEPANYLLVEENDGFSLCILVDQEHCLSSRKIFKQFHLIKVSNLLLSSMHKDVEHHWDSYQIS